MPEDSSIERRVMTLEEHINGQKGQLGMQAKTEIMWRSYIALWTLAGTVVGWTLRSLVP